MLGSKSNCFLNVSVGKLLLVNDMYDAQQCGIRVSGLIHPGQMQILGGMECTLSCSYLFMFIYQSFSEIAFLCEL